jgi:hypothetical protein
MVIQNERGSLLIPFLLLTVIVAISGFGIWGMLRHYRLQVERQLRLDECVGKKAKELESLLHTLTQSNTRMKWVRRSAVLSVLAPEALEVIQAELNLELALQEGLRLKWIAEGGAAVLGHSCEGLRIIPARYPLLSWTRLPPDAIGPQAFTWEDSKPKFNLLFVSAPFRSAAQVQGDPGENKWFARWTDFY